MQAQIHGWDGFRFLLQPAGDRWIVAEAYSGFPVSTHAYATQDQAIAAAQYWLDNHYSRFHTQRLLNQAIRRACQWP